VPEVFVGRVDGVLLFDACDQPMNMISVCAGTVCVFECLLVCALGGCGAETSARALLLLALAALFAGVHPAYVYLGRARLLPGPLIVLHILIITIV